MTPSQRIIDFIKAYEKLRLKAFKPTPNDVWTLAWGRTAGVKEGDTCTIQEADEWFASDLADFSSGVTVRIGPAPTTQNQFDAMVSLAYNIGIAGYGGSTVLRDHRAGDYDGAAAAFLLWDEQAGQVLQGLVSRRMAEAEIYREV